MVRKPLGGLTANEIEKILDKTIRNIIIAELAQGGIETGRGKKPDAKLMKELLSNMTMPSDVPIKKVRVWKEDSTIQPIRTGKPGQAWVLAMLLYPLALVLGTLAFEVGTLPRVLGPIAHIIAAGAPVLLVASITLARGPLTSARRRWAHLLAGSWVTPPLSLFLELLMLVPFGLLMILGLFLIPESQSLLQELAAIDLSSEAELIDLTERLLTQPIVILLGVGLLSGAVPLIEELLKTITIWPLLGKPMSARYAFLGGALGGAGYALFESLFLPQPGEDWVITMVARAGTPLIHAFNTGLVCWGLAEGVQRKRWLFSAGTYILAVGLHGMWNLAAIGIGLAGLGIESDASSLGPSLLNAVGYLGLLGLLGLTVGSLAGLIWLPARLGSEAADLPRRT